MSAKALISVKAGGGGICPCQKLVRLVRLVLGISKAYFGEKSGAQYVALVVPSGWRPTISVKGPLA